MSIRLAGRAARRGLALLTTAAVVGSLATAAPGASAASRLTQAVRELWGNDQPLAAAAAFLMHHPIPFTIGWIILITAVRGPLAIRTFRARTAD